MIDNFFREDLSMQHMYFLVINALIYHFHYLCTSLLNYAYAILLLVQGCADMVAPDHAWHKRAGDVATIGCQHYNKTWHLNCEGSKWNGVIGNCNATGKD